MLDVKRKPTQEKIQMHLMAKKACIIEDELLTKMEKLDDKLPPNTLGQLIGELGGSENVAEITGLKGRVAQNDDGTTYVFLNFYVNIQLVLHQLNCKQFKLNVV